MDKDDSPVHKNWDPVTRSALVILWGLLVYPRLDPDLRKREKEPIADRDFVYEHFQEHFGSREKWEEILTRLKQYDYIRFRDGGKLTAGYKTADHGGCCQNVRGVSYVGLGATVDSIGIPKERKLTKRSSKQWGGGDLPIV